MNWLPHRWCISNDPKLLMHFFISNLGIALAYYVMPLIIWFLTYRKRIGASLGVSTFICFGGFILLCGSTHILDIVVLWIPIYEIQIAVLYATAIVSLFTASILIPRTLALIRRPDEQQIHFVAHRKVESMQLAEMREFIRENKLANGD